MAVPVYLFLGTMFGLLVMGAIRLAVDGPVASESITLPALHPLTLLLILHAFSTGSTALTGVEAISNGVPVFKPPEARNAGRTLMIMAVLMGALFLGSMALTQSLGVTAGTQETILSALARRVTGTGWL